MLYRGKRTLDLVIAIPLFLLSLPLQLLAAAGILITMGKPVIFEQRRPGLYGAPFMLRKFRTMHPRDTHSTPDDEAARIPPFGGFLRHTSIDELPTLMNVIVGDMSLVGPRPLLMEYLESYTPFQYRRMETPPGVTGLAQVSGRNNLSWEERFEKDIEYVDSASFVLDMKVLAKTIYTVLRREGISAEGHATMPLFKGTSPQPKPGTSQNGV